RAYCWSGFGRWQFSVQRVTGRSGRLHTKQWAAWDQLEPFGIEPGLQKRLPKRVDAPRLRGERKNASFRKLRMSISACSSRDSRQPRHAEPEFYPAAAETCEYLKAMASSGRADAPCLEQRWRASRMWEGRSGRSITVQTYRHNV